MLGPIVCFILYIAVLIERRLVTDGQTDRHTAKAYTTLQHSVAE